jgi:hypothetical protein
VKVERIAEDGKPGVGGHKIGVAGVDGGAFPLGLFSHEKPVAVDENRFDVGECRLTRHQGDGRGEDVPVLSPAGLDESIADIDADTISLHKTLLRCMRDFLDKRAVSRP